MLAASIFCVLLLGTVISAQNPLEEEALDAAPVGDQGHHLNKRYYPGGYGGFGGGFGRGYGGGYGRGFGYGGFNRGFGGYGWGK